MTQTPPLAIVGIGCRFPKANGLDAYWANIKAGLDAITEIPDTHWNPKEYFDDDKTAPDMTYAKRGGFIEPLDFDPLEFGITPNNLEATDTTHLLGLIAARDALRDAGYASGKDKKDGRAFDRDRCSAILGVTGTLELVIPLGARLGHPKWRKALKDAGVDDETADDVVKRISHQYVPWQENSFPGLLGNVAAGRIANRFDLGGTNCVVDAACASSLSALHLAAMELYTGRTDMAITGGVDTFNDIFMYMCFSKTPALSPTGNSKPFSADGDGTILGEGVGVVVLKRLDDAQRDNDKIYAVLRGIGSSSDGLGNAIYAPSAQGQSKALKNAYAAADVDPKDVELVEAHGTGTKVGDRIELEALTGIYGQESEDTWCAVGSVKSMIGHTKAAAGVASLIKATLALQHKVLPPSIKVNKPLDIIDPGTAPLYLNTVKRPWVQHESHKRHAALSALGFGGSNFHCVLEEANPIKTEADWDPNIHLFAWSAANKNQLIATLKAIAVDDKTDLRELAKTSRGTFKINDNDRLILVLDNEDLQDRLKSAIGQLESKNDSSWSLPNGTFYGSGKADGKLGVVFPGQGSQRVGMLRDIACQYPEMLSSLDEANTAFGDQRSLQRLSDAIYPIPVFDKDSAEHQETHLRQTNYTQPALGAVSYGAWKICESFGLESHAFAGHSYGELVALAAAGRVNEADLYAMSCKRGQLMASGGGDRGSMLAVSGSLSDIEAVLAKHDWDIVIANRNSPKQAVLSGSTQDIEKAQAVIEKDFRCRRLAVAAAFHSSFVADSEKPFREFLNDIAFTSSATPVYANKTADSYPNDDKATKDILAAQLVNPVSFVEEILAMHQAGINCFVEIGPGNVLSNLIGAILGDEAHHCITLDSSKGRKNGSADLAKCFAQIAALGHTINLAAWDANYEAPQQQASKMAVRISGANYMTARPDIPPSAPKPKPVATNSNSAASAPASAPSPAPTPAPQQQALLQATQQSINALQQMQEQTALLHQQYLASQETAQQSITQLLLQQQQLFNGQPIAPVQITAPAPITPAAVAPINPTPVAAPTPAPAQISTPETPAPVASSSQTSNNTNEIASTLLRIVSEKTGYPDSMLQIEMHLDADLGIDSIKRVEILSALQDEIPGLPSIQADEIGQIQTLADIVEYCSSISESSPVSIPSPNATTNENNLAPILLEIVSEKTGYPQEMLQLSMNLDADLGIDSIKRVEILSALQDQVPELPAVAADDMGLLATLEDIVNYLNASAPVVPSTAPATAPAQTNNNEIQSALLSIVADKTGYPPEMLDINMQLDADLGIDSIKRVEILSALQDAHPHLPTIEADVLSQIHSLADIITACSTVDVSTAPSSASSTSTDSSQLEAELLKIVAEKTGYPIEMLEMDMHLDADLGIDSIKRVEILSSVQEAMPELPAVQADEMGSLQTLRDVCNHLAQHSSAPANPSPTNAAPSAPSAASNNSADAVALTETLLAIVAEKTGYPSEMLDVNMQLDADLGIDSIKRVEILSALQEQVPHAPVVQADEIGNISSLKDIIDHICQISETPSAPAPQIAPAVQVDDSIDENASIKRMPLSLVAIDDYRTHNELQKNDQCVIIDDGSGLAMALSTALPCTSTIITDKKDLENLDNIKAVIVIAQNEFNDDQLYHRFEYFQTALQNITDDALCIAITNQNGFGLQETCDHAYSAAWSGIIKSASHEFDNLHCKVIDCAKGTAADTLVEEIQFAGPLEVTITDDGKFTTHIEAQAVPESQTKLLSADDTVVISGGARGVTADVAKALARRFGCNLALLGRSPLPDQEAAYLADCSDEASIKQALIKNWESGTPTPKAINEQTAKILANREIHQTIAEIKNAGSDVSYHSVNVKDQEQVADCINEIRGTNGSIDGFIHGAGVLADKFILDKTVEQFASVWETKVHGAQNLLKACAADELKCMVFFSSSTARFGRKGQCDYAAANEVLNKFAQQEQKQRSDCKVLSINWGPWDGGMVTKELKALFKSEGVAVINCHAGAEYLCDELSIGPGPVEIVLLGDDEAPSPSKPETEFDSCARVAYEINLSTDSHPFLRSHVMNHRAVLPAAVIMEWLSHAAMHENPGLSLHGMDGLSIFKGVIIEAGERYPLQFHISDTNWEKGIGTCTVELKHNDVLHARAVIRLADNLPEAQASNEATAQSEAPAGNPYEDLRLFHGGDLQGIIDIKHCDASGIVCTSLPAPSADAWIKEPMRKGWYADPMVLDVAFQAMIVWSHATFNSASLPTRVGHYHQYQSQFPKDGCSVIARVRSTKKHAAIADIEFVDASGKLIAKIEDYECVIDPSLSDSFTRNTLREEINS